MIKICYIANPDWPHVGKWARYFISRSNCEIHVVSTQKPHFTGAIWHNLSQYMLQPLPWTISATLAYRQIFRRIRPDLVHVHNVESSFYPAVSAWNGPLVLTAYGLDITRGGLPPEVAHIRLKKMAMLRRSDAVTAASRFLLNAALAYGDVDRAKGSVTPFGVDLQQFVPRKRRNGGHPVTLGFFKDLKSEYGPLQFLKAFQLVRAIHGNVRAIMIGNGPLLGEIKRYLADQSLEGVFELHGKLPHEKMTEMYRRIDLCVMPSSHESFGVVALEAQAMEVPVVATRVEGLPEVVMDGTTGVLLDSNDPGPMAEAVIRLLNDTELRRSMGAAGRVFVEQNFSLESNGRLMEEVYRSVMHA